MILKKVARAGIQVHGCNKFTRLLYYCSQIRNDVSTVLRGDDYKETFKVEIVDEAGCYKRGKYTAHLYI